MAANDSMIGGDHYQKLPGEQHWDRVVRLNLSYLQGCATKYIERCYLKGQTLDDLKKAKHFVEKMIEVEESKLQNKGSQ